LNVATGITGNPSAASAYCDTRFSRVDSGRGARPELPAAPKPATARTFCWDMIILNIPAPGLHKKKLGGLRAHSAKD